MDERSELNGTNSTSETASSETPITDSSDPTSPTQSAYQITISEADIEPETSSNMTMQPPATDAESEQNISEAPTADTEGQESISTQLTTTAISSAAPMSTDKTNKRLIILAAISILLIVVIGIAVAWLLKTKDASTGTEHTSSLPTEQPKLGVAITLVDGTTEYMKPGANWQAATASTELKEGDSIRTLNASRAVLTLDDGSAIRLDAGSTIKLISLAANHVKIQQVDGTIYSRVAVNSERRYVVMTSDGTYEALGTAFTTTETETESGVQVYHSSVKTNLSSEPIDEGKQYYKVNRAASLQGKITDIDVDGLVGNDFISWNLSEDEKDPHLADKLGILARIKERAEAKERERLNAEVAAREQAEKEAAEQAAKEAEMKKKAEEAKQNNTPKGPVERGTMTLVNTGGTLRWTYTGKAIYGYKLVYSKKTTKPTFGKDSSIYFSDIDTMSASLPLKNIDDGKYYVRICAYTADTDPEGCVDYSNFVVMSL